MGAKSDGCYDPFYFSDGGDLVPGTGPYLDTSKLKEEGGDAHSSHNYSYKFSPGVHDPPTNMDGIYMPQSKIRQRPLYNQTAPDGGNDLIAIYNSCLGTPIDYCFDDYRYWPAFRIDANVPTTITSLAHEKINRPDSSSSVMPCNIGHPLILLTSSPVDRSRT